MTHKVEAAADLCDALAGTFLSVPGVPENLQRMWFL